MMSRDAHFYLMLPSNASTDIFPDNKMTSYCIKLPKTVNLEGDWEVGVYSIIYPNSWYTLENKSDKKHIYFGYPPHGFITSVSLDYGHFESVEEFIEKANETMKNTKFLKGGVQFKENKLTKKITLVLNLGYSLTLNARVSRILGFAGVVKRYEKTTESPYVADLSVLSTIYLYCDIVEPQVVRDVSYSCVRKV